MYTLKLNKRDHSITLKKVNRTIELQQVGRRGPKGDPGDIDSDLFVHIAGLETITGEKRFFHLGIISSTGKLWLLDVLDSGELVTIETDEELSGIYTTNYEEDY